MIDRATSNVSYELGERVRLALEVASPSYSSEGEAPHEAPLCKSCKGWKMSTENKLMSTTACLLARSKPFSEYLNANKLGRLHLTAPPSRTAHTNWLDSSVLDLLEPLVTGRQVLCYLARESVPGLSITLTPACVGKQAGHTDLTLRAIQTQCYRKAC